MSGKRKCSLGWALMLSGLSAVQGAHAAAERPQPEFHNLAPQDVQSPLADRTKIKAAPVQTGMRGTLRPDGTVELRCVEEHQHAGEQRPDAEQVK